MSDSIIVRVTLDAYDMASTGRQTQVYVQIPEVARVSWLLPSDMFHGLKDRAWPEVLDVAHDYAEHGGMVVTSDAASSAARAAVRAWLLEDANRDEMQAAYELDQARRNPITRKLLAVNARLLDRVAELAEHGIAGSADALPVPVREEPQEDPVAAGRRLDLLALMDERAASAVSPVLAGVLDEAERLRARIAELEAQRERRRVRLVACEADLGEMRGLLSPNGFPRRIPPEVAIHERVAPAVEWLLNRVSELEARLAEYERPVDEDPIAYALTETAPLTVFRASHDSIVMGLYTTREAARAHCETVLRREIGDTAGDLGWIPDDGSDGSAEELSLVGPGVDEDGVPYDTATGYVVTPLEVAAAYDPDGDE